MNYYVVHLKLIYYCMTTIIKNKFSKINEETEEVCWVYKKRMDMVNMLPREKKSNFYRANPPQQRQAGSIINRKGTEIATSTALSTINICARTELRVKWPEFQWRLWLNSPWIKYFTSLVSFSSFVLTLGSFNLRLCMTIIYRGRKMRRETF